MKKLLMSCIFATCVVGCGATNELAGNEYQLMEPTPVMPITLGFSAKENRFAGKAVNNYFGSYQVDGQTLTLSPAGSTMMMGAPKEMAAERTYLATLPNVSGYQQNGDTLTLTVTNGQPLVFQKTGTVSE